MSTNKMLIDATHPEETRVVVLRNGRVEEFDYESAARKLLRGNIYLAKVTRVEPALQAAFIDYGGNRHGFLAFNEIHPDYYQIPIADRQALLDEEAAAEAAEEAAVDARAEALAQRQKSTDQEKEGDDEDDEEDGEDDDEDGGVVSIGGQDSSSDGEGDSAGGTERAEAAQIASAASGSDESVQEPVSTEPASSGDGASSNGDLPGPVAAGTPAPGPIEQVGSEDALEEVEVRPRRRPRSYKIHEVIKRRQVILIQVVKEERGNKGAALTTYLSLAGRYTVLMPNTARGGGISRKITNPADRKRLKAIASELEVPEGMGLIIRTAGAARTKQEIRRDFEYLLRLWESVREMTLASTAPSLVYEEGNLIKRSIRDLYTKEIEEVVVAGPEAHREAKDFMRMLMPSHAKNVLAFESPEPLFTKFQIERQLNAMFSPYVTLRSGGYLVINQTEALVAVDVNSGKSTREFSIEETALNTNLEAADEVARQLKLRDLAGLIVVDFIDMEEKRNNRAVERRMKDALRFDRARIQVGRISHFGLLEMSRQRLRTGVLEGSTSQCPHCQGTGIIRSTESVALAVLRGIEDAILAGANTPLIALTTASVALYILNNKRAFILDMEQRHGLPISVQGSEKMQGASFTIEKGAAPAQPVRRPQRAAVSMDWGFEGEGAVEDTEAPVEFEAEPDRDEPAHDHVRSVDEEEGDGRGRSRRGRGRRRRGRRSDYEATNGNGHDADRSPRNDSSDDSNDVEVVGGSEAGMDSVDEERGERTVSADAAGEGDDGRSRRRRRGRRGGRRGRDRAGQTTGLNGSDENVAPPAHEREFASSRDSAEFDQDAIAQAEQAVYSRKSARPAVGRDQHFEPPSSQPAVTATVAAAANGNGDGNAVQDNSSVGVATAPSSPVRRGRIDRGDSPQSVEPRLERVVLGPNDTRAVDAAEPDEKPMRKGWWQRRFGGE